MLLMLGCVGRKEDGRSRGPQIARDVGKWVQSDEDVVEAGSGEDPENDENEEDDEN